MYVRRSMARAVAAAAALGLLLAACGGADDEGVEETEEATDSAEDDGADEDGEAEESAASDFPNQPITIVVPYAAGGGVDLTARILADHLGDYIGENVVVENVTGGGGAIGFQTVADAEPDGYTLLLGATPMVHQEYLRADEIDYGRDSFAPVYNLTDVPHNLVVRSDLSDDLDEHVAAMADGDGLVMGVGGQWATMDVSRGIFENAVGESYTRVVYDGGADVIAAMLAGDVDAAMLYADESGEQVRAGSLVPVATAGENRLDAEGFEDVPTFEELGFDIFTGTWRGILAPAGTPEDVLAALESAIAQAIEDPDYIAAMEDAGIPIIPADRQAFEAVLDRDHAASQAVAETLLAEMAEEGMD